MRRVLAFWLAVSVVSVLEPSRGLGDPLAKHHAQNERGRRVRFRNFKANAIAGPVGDLIRELVTHHKASWKHSIRVAHLSYRIAMEMGLPEHDQHRAWLAGLAHDVGKLDIPLEILDNADPLEPFEREILDTHPTKGAARLSKSHAPGSAVNAALTHHERPDGLGYPQHLKGRAIPRFGRIVAVADAYEAITAHRAYQSDLTKADAYRILREGRGLKWDASVVDAFLRVRGLEP